MYILVINQTDTTIKPLKATTMREAKDEEAKILGAGYSEGGYHSEIVCISKGRVTQTYRDRHPITHQAQEAIWTDRNCAVIRRVDL